MGKIPYGTATYARVDGAFRQFLSIIQNDPAAARMIGNEENYDLVKTLLRLITQTSSLESLKKSLSDFVKSEITKSAEKKLSLSDSKISGGFSLYLKDKKLSLEFSDESVASLLSDQLRSEMRKYLFGN